MSRELFDWARPYLDDGDYEELVGAVQQKWLMEELDPIIREHGTYALDVELGDIRSDILGQIKRLTEKAKQIEAARMKNAGGL